MGAKTTMNCWEYSGCGREQGGARAREMGVCPAASLTSCDGFLGGRNGGRACAYVAGTYCSGTVQGTYQDKTKQCRQCGFYQRLMAEHGGGFSVLAFASYVRARDPRSYAAIEGLPPAPSR